MLVKLTIFVLGPTDHIIARLAVVKAAGRNEHSKVNSDLYGDNVIPMNNLGDFIRVLSC